MHRLTQARAVKKVAQIIALDIIHCYKSLTSFFPREQQSQRLHGSGDDQDEERRNEEVCSFTHHRMMSQNGWKRNNNTVFLMTLLPVDEIAADTHRWESQNGLMEISFASEFYYLLGGGGGGLTCAYRVND